MCEPTTIAIVAGVGTAAGGGMKAIAQHRAQKAAARRQNQINQLKFQHELQIAAHKDQVKANEYNRQLEIDQKRGSFPGSGKGGRASGDGFGTVLGQICDKFVTVWTLWRQFWHNVVTVLDQF